jgi:hypothetical protein
MQQNPAHSDPTETEKIYKFIELRNFNYFSFFEKAEFGAESQLSYLC